MTNFEQYQLPEDQQFTPDNRTEVLISPQGNTSTKNRASINNITFGTGGRTLNFNENIGLQVGPPLGGSSAYAPFYVTVDGNIRRVAAIWFASASDLGKSSIDPGTNIKSIWAKGNDMRIQCISTGKVMLVRAGKQYAYSNQQKSGLTNAAATSIFLATMGSNNYNGGSLRWTVTATDGTDYQTTSGVSSWSAANKGGAITSQVVDSINSTACSSGTLTGAWSIANSTNDIILKFTPNSSLVTTSIVVYVQANCHNMFDLTTF